ncbi:hypothetical protein Btru_069274 [Bulinus truncatus]|nr:hypothetical protein Btru_069274 [Bulinus truncatus]
MVRMFDSRSKKQPTLVFAHKSQQNAAKNVGHEVTKIPRVALVGSGTGNDPLVANSPGQQQQQQPIEHPPKLERQSLQRQGQQMNNDLQNTQTAQNMQRLNQSPNVETILQGLEIKERPGAKIAVKTADGEGLTKNSGQSSGQQNILYKDVAYAVVKSAAAEEKNNFAVPKIEQYEGYSIYRGAREVTVDQAPTGEISSKAPAPTQTKTTDAMTLNTTTINLSLVSNKNDDEKVLLRHPNSASNTNTNANTSGTSRTVASANPQQPYQTVQKQHMQYQRTHQILQAQQQSAIAEHGRQVQMMMDPGHATTLRVQSYPQASHQVVVKSIRLVGPSPADVAYTPVKVRVAASPVKQRPHSYSASTKTWQVAAVPVKYAVMGQDGNVYMIKHGSGVSPRQSYRDEQEAASLPKPLTPNSNVRPKSILKNQTQPEVAPEWHQNARAIHIPRAQSLKNPPATPVQTYDFSNILTANSDTVSYVRSTGAHADPTARPVSADATLQTSDNAEPGTPQKKSVKFNTQVRLHTDDHVSNVITLAT